MSEWHKTFLSKFHIFDMADWPQIVLYVMSCFRLNFFNHPFDALKSLNSKLCATSRAFLWAIGPEIGKCIFRVLQITTWSKMSPLVFFTFIQYYHLVNRFSLYLVSAATSWSLVSCTLETSQPVFEYLSHSFHFH